ncbi:sensor domain-containing diguanylate cyclase [Comamonas sp. NLF-1-9]|uniref:sensor domain-containing diguanylate cyclase n=1 Tax=Comamonas sp. NLF-1-9 TaxID=2853163 RepID=UPI001C4852CA|nr:sensor domain-containing diguanylate cyclase [Comamonas sp. NLF-1-9]QXL83975.1 diguanylate cyclase [Comamonas sp. NLF-1-9]
MNDRIFTPEHGRGPRPCVHWLVRQNRRHRTWFFPLIAAMIGAQLHDLDAAASSWLFLALHFFVYPQLVYLRTTRPKSPAGQRDVELRWMVLDNVLYGLWFAALGFPLWICYVISLAGVMSLVAYHGLSGVVRAVPAQLAGAALGVPLFGPLVWHVQTGVLVTALCMGSFVLFSLMYAYDAYVRARRLKDSRQVARNQVDEIRLLQTQLRAEALCDPLTGLHNRRHLSEALPGALARCARLKLPLTLVMIDIDHFKRVNDTHGHAAGDTMLQALARLLQGHVRQGDTVCRMGGEEFLLVLENAALEPAWQRTQALRLAFADLAVVHDGSSLRATISCGLATFPEDGGDAPSLLQAADRALYAAKEAGRNRLQAARPCV